MTYKQELSIVNKLYKTQFTKIGGKRTRVPHRGWQVIRSNFELMGHGDHVPGYGPLRKGCSLETRTKQNALPESGPFGASGLAV